MREHNETHYRSEEFMVQAMDKWSCVVYKLALAQTTSRVDAEDVHQEVFIKLYKSSRSFENDEHIKAWLLRVTINCCRDLDRSGWRRKVTTAEELDDFTSENCASSLEIVHDLIQALEQLPEETRAIIHLHYFEGYSSADIAQVMDINASTVRSRLERARKQLRVSLEVQQ